ncbi:MAG: 23S rRNA (adenine(2503)-C(2))-methyltransferase RlmN [Alphaproteobacteria bacterium]|nr:23S rRNA (adenine(2503)-C(2))-methyltransferase RlmN [Alphaproteobacteria bacterium]
MQKQSIIGLDKQELTELLTSWGQKTFHVKQIWQWIYFRGAKSFDEMTNLSKDLRQKLQENFTLSRPKIVAEQISKDKTHKWLLEFDDGERVEMVYIPESDRGAVCISTQVGCAMGCKFCHTGSQKLTRNLTAGEIVLQFMVARDTYGEWPSPTDETRYLSNIVVMGMGEPLQNEENVIKALNILSDGDGIAVSRRRITMSTCGIAPKICDVLEKTGVRLAVSLHASNDEIRNTLMPINKVYNIEQILKEAQKYQQKDGSRYITFEYLMLDGINDSTENAKELIELLKKHKIRATFNLIPFNPWPGCDFKPSTPQKVKAFADLLNKAGFAAPVRVARGQDILAACGQLKSTQK